MSGGRLDFRLEGVAEGSRARAGRFRTMHNEVLTPLFMPVGTQATVKAQLPEALEAAGSQILLANTYHLLLRPGVEVFRRVGGIHGLMNWGRSVLTDSGGFQIFSLPHSRSMSEEGAIFQSYLDGQTILLSPEVSIETQKAIGSDIMMVLDQCIPSTASEAAAREALGITHRWAARSLAARGESGQAMFGIVQGGLDAGLRCQSAEGLQQIGFDGYAIGGLYMAASLVVWGMFVRMVIVLHATWCINSVTHVWGYKTYDNDDDSKNLWWVAVLTFGEGWHNNHHAYQKAANYGHRWWEFDTTYQVIRLMRAVGLAWAIAPIPQKALQILARKRIDRRR